MSRDEFSQIVRDRTSQLSAGVHVIRVPVSGQEFTCRLRIVAEATSLLIHFHGSVDRKVYKVPKLPSLFPIPGVHELSIPDPSLELVNEVFSAAWYAGHAGFDSQAILTQFFHGVADALGAERVIYTGNSSGGFAALYFSYQHDESIAIAGNPQTRVLDHHRRNPVDEYLRSCWPGESRETVGSKTCLDLVDLYSGGFNNTVVYVQSLGDFVHYNDHMLPFMAAAGQTEDKSRFLLHCDVFGRMGHVAPVQAYLDWITAIEKSPSNNVEDIVSTLPEGRLLAPQFTRKDASPSGSSASAPKQDTVSGKSAFSGEDAKLADRIREWRSKQ